MPDALIAFNGVEKYLFIHNVWFERGQLEIYEAMANGVAISFRFQRDKKGWRILASTEREDFRKEFSAQIGVIGLDLNVDYLALTETDWFGNLRTVGRVPCVLQGKTSGQRKAIAQRAAVEAVAYAEHAGKPLAVEKFDFAKKKKQLASLKGDPRLRRRNRQLNSFAYGAIIQSVHGRALQESVPVKEVNPAFTSVIGRIKYAKRHGASVHQAAALAIGRRGMSYSETVPVRGQIPDGKDDHLLVKFPARKLSAHEWAHWGRISNAVQAILSEWHRL
ncbi:MAG: hypothetical protein H7293_01945 [Candidatus Saccharibacteria bacterium]|nr:hypothetical protein [Rhodoferax sp.]